MIFKRFNNNYSTFRGIKFNQLIALMTFSSSGYMPTVYILFLDWGKTKGFEN